MGLKEFLIRVFSVSNTSAPPFHYSMSGEKLIIVKNTIVSINCRVSE